MLHNRREMDVQISETLSTLGKRESKIITTFFII